MKCDICGKEFDYGFTFITVNEIEVNACEDCILKRSEQVEEEVAKNNAN